MSIISKETVVAAEQAGRVDKVVQALTGRSRSQVRGLVDHGCVCINGAPIDSDATPVAAGDRVDVRYNPDQGYPEKSKARAGSQFKILYEDNDLLVVDKAAHLLTVPTLRREKDTLVHLLQQYVSVGRRRLGRVEIVHRLDRGVSGVLVFAKSVRIAEQLREQFSQHKPKREYVAIVAGRLATNEGTFRKNIDDDERTLQRYCPDDPDAGEAAVTHYKVIRRFPGATMASVWLETGRRNQIRVHFADAGHPVLGDPRYGTTRKHPRWKRLRMALHAVSLAFVHPVTGRHLEFKTQLPHEFTSFS
jgi:23S rRNA pseudouridine1911/1915/1917 synthase